MKKFRLSTDIISPIHSDISMNDSSLASFDSISGTPDFKKTTEPLRCGSFERDSSSVDSFCKATLKESAAAFDVVVNDIKKQSNINAEKEERFKESYKVLKHSMDELYKKISHPSILSPVSSDINFENENFTEKVSAQKKSNRRSDMPKNPKDWEEKESTKSRSMSKISSKKSKVKEESRLKKKDNNEQSKNVCLLKETTEKSKHSENKTCLKREIGVNESYSVWELQNPKTTKTVSSSTQTYEHFEAEVAYKKDNLRDFYLEKQRKPAVSNVVSAAETKVSSIETSIQIAIGMEMDNLRRLMMEQNLCSCKELLKLKEEAKKQREVKEYLFSVIEELIDENKKLLSKRNKT